MDNVTNNDGTQNTPNTPITFSDEQKSAITTIIEDRLTRQTNKHRADLDKALADQKLAHDAEIARLKEASKGKGGEPLTDAEKEQYKALLEAEKRQTVAERALREQSEARIKEVEGTNAKIVKDVAIRDAIFDQDTFTFVDANVVKTLTEGSVVYDSELGKFVIKDEAGVIQQNSSLQPQTLKEFYAAFAAKHPYLVASKAKSGTGAGESSRTMAGGLSKIASKADFKNSSEKSEYIKKFGYDQFAALPTK